MTALNVGGTIDLPKAGASVTIVNAIHGSDLLLSTPPETAPGHRPGRQPGGFVLQINDGPTIYHTGDTAVYEDMKLIPMFHQIDLMLACIGGYFTMDPAGAALAVEWVQPNARDPHAFRHLPGARRHARGSSRPRWPSTSWATS